MMMKLPGFILLFYFLFFPFAGSFCGLRAGEQLIASFMQEANYSQALVLANQMPSLYILTGDELTEHNYYLDMLNLQTGLVQQGRNILQLNGSEVSNLLQIASSSKGTAGTQAKSILEFGYGYHFANCLNVSDTLAYKSSTNQNMQNEDRTLAFEMNVEPNPANYWTVFNYRLPANEAEAFINITDVNGKFITTIKISGLQGQTVWDTRNLKAGMYFYNSSYFGQVRSGKIIINH